MDSAITSALLPLLAAGALFHFARGRPDPERARRFGVFAPAAAFVIAYVALVGIPPLPLDRILTGREGLFWLVVGSTPILAVVRERHRSWLVLTVTALLLLGVARAALRHQWSRTEAFAYLFGLGVAFLFLEHVLQALARRRAGVALPGTLTLSVGGLAACAVFTSNALIGQLLGGLACGLLAISLLSILRPASSFAGTGLLMSLLIQCGLGFSLAFYGNLAKLDVVVLVAAPLLAWLVEPIPLSTRKREWARAFVVALPVTLVVARHAIEFANDPYFG